MKLFSILYIEYIINLIVFISFIYFVIYLSIYLFDYLVVWLFVCLFVCLFEQGRRFYLLYYISFNILSIYNRQGNCEVPHIASDPRSVFMRRLKCLPPIANNVPHPQKRFLGNSCINM